MGLDSSYNHEYDTFTSAEMYQSRQDDFGPDSMQIDSAHTDMVREAPDSSSPTNQDFRLAGCNGLGHIFFGPMQESTTARITRESRAKDICEVCPKSIFNKCLEFAQARREYGIWGGTTEEERFIIYGVRNPELSKRRIKRAHSEMKKRASK